VRTGCSKTTFRIHLRIAHWEIAKPTSEIWIGASTWPTDSLPIGLFAFKNAGYFTPTYLAPSISRAQPPVDFDRMRRFALPVDSNSMSHTCTTVGRGLSSTNDAWGGRGCGPADSPSRVFRRMESNRSAGAVRTPYCLARSMADCQKDSGNFVRLCCTLRHWLNGSCNRTMASATCFLMSGHNSGARCDCLTLTRSTYRSHTCLPIFVLPILSSYRPLRRRLLLLALGLRHMPVGRAR
jgi:hypothetical protein